MASSSNILKEFLIAIGFKVDDEQFRKMQNTILKVQDVMESLAAATTAVAALIDKNVIQMADSFDKLYYASQRIGTSVQSLQTFQYAAKMIGLSAETATSSLEGMARAIRLNPGLVGLLNQRGIRVEGRETHDVAMDLLGQLKTQQDSGRTGAAIAAQIGQMFGIDPDTLNVMLKNFSALKSAENERRQMFASAGLNPDKMARESFNFETNLLRMNTEIEVLRALVAERFMPAVDWLVGGLTKVVSFLSNADKATGGVSTYAGAGGVLATTAAGAYFGKKWIASLLPTIGRGLGITAAADGAAGAAGAAEVGLGAEAVGASGPAGWAIAASVAAAAAVGWMALHPDKVINTAKSVWGSVKGELDALPGQLDELGQNLPGLIEGMTNGLIKFVDGVGDGLPKLIDAIAQGLPTVIDAVAKAMPSIIEALIRNVPNIFAAVLDAENKLTGHATVAAAKTAAHLLGFSSNDRPRATSTGGKTMNDIFSAAASIFGVSPEILKAVAQQESGQRQTDSRGNVITSVSGAQGIMQLMPGTARSLGVNPLDAGENVQGGAHLIANLLKKYGGHLDQALAAYNWGEPNYDNYLKHGGHLPAETQNYVASIMSSLQNHRLGDTSKGASSVVLNQKTDIHVHGGDAHSTAREVHRGQNEINAGIRNALSQPT